MRSGGVQAGEVLVGREGGVGDGSMPRCCRRHDAGRRTDGPRSGERTRNEFHSLRALVCRVGRLGGLTGDSGSGYRATGRRRDFRLRLRVQTAEHAIGRARVALEVDAARSMTASTSGLGDRHQRCHPLRARVAAMTERDLSQHDQRPQSAFRQIVGRRNSRVVEKHEPLAGTQGAAARRGRRRNSGLLALPRTAARGLEVTVQYRRDR